jgi:dipeptidyl aminopeptidase/acylaminoacyl peptidase
VTESVQIIEKIRSNGKMGQLVIGKNEGHGFAKKANIDVYLDIEANFIETVLKEANSKPASQ